MKRSKKIFLLLSLVLSVLLSCTFLKAQETPDESEDSNKPVVDSIDINENLLDSNEAYKKQFDSLSNEGEWKKVNKSEFLRDLTENTGEDFDIDYSGTPEVVYVWRPYCAGPYWNPYINGNWVFTYYGWIWVSFYNWGWGPYNYGRWYCSNLYGWVWLPGRIWAPNWVTWRYHNNYVGWYPTCPRVYWRNHRNIICTNNLFSYVPSNWVFVKKDDFIKKIDHTTIISAGSNAGILTQARKTSTTTYAVAGSPKIKYNGPDVNDISKETGKIISPKEVIVTNTKKIYSGEKNLSTYKKPENKNEKEEVRKTNENNPVKSNTSGKEKYSGTKQENNNPPADKKTKKVRSKKTKINKDSGNKEASKVNKENNTEPEPKKTDSDKSSRRSENRSRKR
jgi:Family of unknown function (DUF6600)